MIVARALEVLLEKTLETKAAVTERPRPMPASIDHEKRGIPAAIRRKVWERDEGRCAFVSKDGRRCNETRYLELAHLKPWAKGGQHGVDEIELRCRGHNDFEAVRDYGPELMALKRPDPRVRELVATYESMDEGCRNRVQTREWVVGRGRDGPSFPRGELRGEPVAGRQAGWAELSARKVAWRAGRRTWARPTDPESCAASSRSAIGYRVAGAPKPLTVGDTKGKFSR